MSDRSSESIEEEAKSSEVDQGKLLKAVGVWFGISAAVGNTIAAGIVRTPGDIARWLPNEILFLLVWVIGGMYALAGASSLAELACAIPKSGGQYNYSRRALGEYAGFVVGWSDWLSNCGTLAAVAIVVGEYVEDLIPATMGMFQVIAVSTIISFAILQSRGVDWGSKVQVITAVMKTIAFLILVIACFIVGPLGGTPIIHPTKAIHLASGWPLIVSLMLAMQAVFYTIDGWHGIIYLGEEVKDPAKEIPRTIFISVFSIVAIYLSLNAAVLFVVPIDEVAGNKFALGLAAEHVFGQWGGPIIRVIMIISLLSCINAVQMFASRILYGLSHDGLFFHATAKVNKGGTPVRALILSTLIAILFVSLGSFEKVMAILAFFFVANYLLSYISIFVLRKKEPELERPYRAWGYPWTSGIALVTSASFLIAALVANPDTALFALGIIVVSFPVYKYFRHIADKDSSK